MEKVTFFALGLSWVEVTEKRQLSNFKCLLVWEKIIVSTLNLMMWWWKFYVRDVFRTFQRCETYLLMVKRKISMPMIFLKRHKKSHILSKPWWPLVTSDLKNHAFFCSFSESLVTSGDFFLVTSLVTSAWRSPEVTGKKNHGCEYPPPFLRFNIGFLIFT